MHARAQHVFIALAPTDLDGGGYYAQIRDENGFELFFTDTYKDKETAKVSAYSVCADENWGILSVEDLEEDDVCFRGSSFGPSVAQVEAHERRRVGT